MMVKQNSIEVCFSPALFPFHEDREAIVVIIDVLRATSAIVTAFQNGVERLIPVKTIDEAREYKKRGFVIAAERDGYVLDFADFGNSPLNFTRERVAGKTIVYSTTNGTQAIQMASSCYRVVIGSFLNISVLCDWIAEEKRNALLLCSGWKNRFSLEDAICAGAIVEKLLANASFHTQCDAAKAVYDLWSLAKEDLGMYVEKVAQKSRLREKGLDDVIPYCHTPDSCEAIPVLKDGYLIDIKNF